MIDIDETGIFLLSSSGMNVVDSCVLFCYRFFIFFQGVSMINCQTGRTCSGFMIDNPETTIQVNGGVRVSDGGPGGSTDVGYSFTGTSGSSSGLYYNPDSSVGLNLRFNGNIGLRLVSGAGDCVIFFS